MRLYQSLTQASHWLARTPALRIACATALVSIASCKPEDALPGTALGSFAVTAVLSTNTCGSGLAPTNPWKFDAELSLDGNTLYFRAKDEDEVSAPLDSENTATCTSVVNSQSSTDRVHAQLENHLNDLCANALTVESDRQRSGERPRVF